MRLVERMTMDPQRCLACGCGNVEDADGNIGPFLDLEVEVGWGDSVYLDMNCVTKMALLFDFMTPDDKKDLEAAIERLRHEKHDLAAKLEEKERRLTAIADARKALRKEREERKSKKKKVTA